MYQLSRVEAPGPLGILATRIVNFRVSDTRPAVGQPVRITGKIEAHSIFCTWARLKGVKLQFMLDQSVVDETYSSSDGTFAFTWYPRETGDYFVKVYYPGSWLAYKPCSSPEVLVSVITEEEKKKQEQQFWIMMGVIGVIGLGGVVAAAYLMQRQKELLLIRG